MTLTHSLTLPPPAARSPPLRQTPSSAARTPPPTRAALPPVLSNIEKVSKVFNYMARIFSSTSAMLNNFITIYNTVKQLNEFISNNF